VGAHVRGEKRRKFFWLCPSTCLALQVYDFRPFFVKRFRDGQYSLVSLLCAVNNNNNNNSNTRFTYRHNAISACVNCLRIHDAPVPSHL